MGSSVFSKALLRRQLQKKIEPCEIVRIELEDLCADPEELAKANLWSTQEECTEITQDYGSEIGCNLKNGTGTLNVVELERVFFEEIYPE